MLGGAIQFFKDSLFPIFCVDCGKEGEWWCKNCLRKEEIGVFRCPVCGKQSPKGKTCENCRSATALDGVVAIFNLVEHRAVESLIHSFKYSFTLDMQKLWRKVIENNFLLLFGDLGKDWLVVPVPLHQKRKRERGFNQSEVVAKIVQNVGREHGFICQDCLRRTKYTKQQAKLDKLEREKNVWGTFECVTSPVKSKILLVDDVFTTGSTMNECARILKENGVREVRGVVLARG
ncbi:MAG TPA: ComF family protein [Patescibacteria group bacterium]|nr:ComF family protein [Patescibacteria group bacterium]